MMRIARPIAIALLLWLFEPLALLAPLVCLFIRWDSKPSTDSNGQGLTIRGDLPAGFMRNIWQTPDERCPGGTYEAEVAKVLKDYGRYWCSVYWLGVRNRLQGLAFQFSQPMEMPWDPTLEYQSQGPELWFRRVPFNLFGWFGVTRWPLQWKLGYRSYLIQGKVYGVPCFTFTKP